VTVESQAFGGDGVARCGGLVILVEGGVAGDRARVRITQVARTFARARLVEILAPSDQRLPPPCSHFGECGGCAYQSLEYPAQLASKRQQVADLLMRIGKFREPRVLPTLAGAHPLHYRVRMTYTLPSVGGALPGLHRRHPRSSVLEVPFCLLPKEEIQEAYRRIAQDLRHLLGDQRPLQVRIQSGDADSRPTALLIGLRRRPGRALRDLALRWTRADGPLEGVSWSGVGAPALHAEAGGARLLAGRDGSTHLLGPYRLRVPAGSFFQANCALAARLFEEVSRRCLGIAGPILEVFGGVGALSLFLAAAGHAVLMVEGDPASARAARENAEANGCQSIQVRQEEAGAALRRLARQGARPGVVVLDPPRAGISREQAVALSRLAQEKILYVSCDPATLARDLRVIASGGRWRLSEVLPVDLFPQTAEVECLAELLPAGKG
jgi:23S rRNA (uracil1939-C5)-methyltransferase